MKGKVEERNRKKERMIEIKEAANTRIKGKVKESSKYEGKQCKKERKHQN